MRGFAPLRRCSEDRRRCVLSAAAGRVFDTKYKMFMVLELVTGGELLERCPPARPPALPPSPAFPPFADRGCRSGAG